MNNSELLKMLEVPKGKIDVVLDTDTFNEIDDQYAIAYMLRSDDKLNTKAIYAAPFFNSHSTSPED
ncbi:MAG: nucleoside hydrolase, partial [Clostridia bacterium]|nr:nucleoside hydrolase [Clostridia bacterium]